VTTPETGIDAETPAAGSDPDRGHGYRALSRNRDFGLIWVGLATSELGTSVSGVALPLLVLAVGTSGAITGLIGSVMLLVGWLSQLPAGYLADRYDRRLLMVICDAARMVLMAGVTISAFTGRVPVWWVLGVVVVSTMAWAVYMPAEAQAVRAVVAPEQVPEAVAVSQARAYAVELCGPALGGLLFSLRRTLPFLVDTVSFLISLVCVLSVRTSLRPKNPGAVERRFLPSVRAGWQHVWRDPLLRSTTVYSTAINLSVTTLIYVVIVGEGRGSAGGVTVGVAISGAAAAGLVGSLIAPRAQRRLSLRVLLSAAPVLVAVLLLLAARIGNAGVLAVVLAMLTLVSPITNVAISALLMVRVPEEIYGRAMSSVSFVATALQPLGPVGAGLLLDHTSLSTALVVLAAGFLLVTVTGLLVPNPERPATAAHARSVGR